MSVVDIHPEELLDKWARAALAPSEQERLQAHLARCEVCRCELALRVDLDEEFAARPLPSMPSLLTRAPATRRRARVPARIRQLLSVAAAAGFVLGLGSLVAYAAPRALSWLRAEPAERSLPAPRSVLSAPRSRVPSALWSRSESSADPAASAVGSSESASSAAPAQIATGEQASPRTSGLERRRASSLSAGPSLHTGSASLAEPSHASAAELFSAANRARRAGDVRRAAEIYRSLQRGFPRSHEAQLSRVTLGTLLLTSNPGAALESFDGYLTSGAQALAVEAQVGRARALRALNRSGEARAAWQQLLSRYPKSVYAAEAREMLGVANAP